MIRRSRRIPPRMLHDIPLTPLIDTALTLLVIFMIAAPMMQNAIKVTLPRGSQQETAPNTPLELVIYVDANNVLYWDNKKMSLAEICAQIKKTVHSTQDQILFVKADEHASYGTVLELVDRIKGLGVVRHVALATQKAVHA